MQKTSIARSRPIPGRVFDEPPAADIMAHHIASLIAMPQQQQNRHLLHAVR
jgi:hypothetical protein